jgi:hypothetical protein
MSNQNSAQKTAAQKNQVKKSTFKTRLEINKAWKESELSLNGVFKYIKREKKGNQNSKLLNGADLWLSDLNEELKTLGKSLILIEDINLSNFLEKIKTIEVTFKGEIKPYLSPEKKLFSPAFILRGFELISKA